jgi:hypothetical protein
MMPKIFSQFLFGLSGFGTLMPETIIVSMIYGTESSRNAGKNQWQQ